MIRVVRGCRRRLLFRAVRALCGSQRFGLRSSLTPHPSPHITFWPVDPLICGVNAGCVRYDILFTFGSAIAARGGRVELAAKLAGGLG